MKDYKKLGHLVTRVQKGDSDAFVELYALFSKDIYYNAIKLVGNESDAKDILQEVMLRLYSQLDQIKNPRSLPIYLYRSTYNLCVDLWRQQKKVDPSIEDTLVYQALGEEKRRDFLPEEYAENREQRAELLDTLDQLHPDYRAVLLMFYFDELSIHEIAQIMDTNNNTARVKLQRARQALKRQLTRAQKEGVPIRAMSIPVLTRVMRYNADDLFSSDISSQVWTNIAPQIGLSTAALYTVTAGNTAAVSAGAVATAKGASLITGIKAAAAVFAAGAVSVAVWNIPDDLVPTSQMPDISNDIYSSELHGADIDSPALSLTSDSHMAGEQPFPDNQAEPHTPHETAEAPTSAESSGTDTPFYSYNTPIRSSTDTLFYPVGTALSAQTIFHDAGFTGPGASLQYADIYGLEQIDTSKPNKHLVFFTFSSAETDVSFTFALIIVIE